MRYNCYRRVGKTNKASATYLCNEPVNEDLFGLAVSIRAEYSLNEETRLNQRSVENKFEFFTWQSFDGFHDASKITTLFAPIIFVPIPPALVETRNKRHLQW